MASFRLNIIPISRGAGRSAVAAAAYRAGERLRDERTGQLHNFSRRTDVRHREILLPGGMPAGHWATERSALWNCAERAERQRNARVAREYQLNLYPELDERQRLQLARRFAQELADRHGVAVDLAVHEPRPGGDARNHHAHLLATSRQIGLAGLGVKAGLDMQSSVRQRLGLLPGIAEIKALRERWAVLSNEALEAAGLTVRVDHRTLRAQGIDREPYPVLPSVVWRMEHRGIRTWVGERIRERYRARVQARQAQTAEAAPAQGREPLEALEEMRRQARETWLQLRQQGAAAAVPTPPDSTLNKESERAQSATQGRSRGALHSTLDAGDRDLAL